MANKKDKKAKKVLKTKKPEVNEDFKLPDFKNEDYLRTKKAMEASIIREREEVEKILAEERRQQEEKEENLRKVRERIAEQKRKEDEEKEISEAYYEGAFYEQPEEVKQIDIFTNYQDKRMRQRVKEIERTNTLKDDFRVNKYIQINKLPTKQRTAKLDTPDQVATMLMSSKKEIFEKSGKAKVLKKAKLSKEDKLLMDKLFAERTRLEAKMITMFQPSGAKIPMYEIYWIVQNTIVSLQKIYKNLKNPLKNITEYAFCDSLVWSTRYLLEMVYTESYPLEFLKQDCLDYSQNLYTAYKLKDGKVDIFDVESATIDLMKYIIERFRYSSMVVNM